MPVLVLDLLKYVFLAVLYIFLARAVRAVYLELRPQPQRARGSGAAPAPTRKSRKAPKKLAIVEGPLKGKSFEITDEMTIGRGDKCHLVLEDTYVSQVHARVYPRDESIVVEDLGSTNGTYVNRRRLRGATELQRGDQIKIGKTVLEAKR